MFKGESWKEVIKKKKTGNQRDKKGGNK